MEELAAILLTTDEEEAIGKHPDYPDALIRLASRSVHHRSYTLLYTQEGILVAALSYLYIKRRNTILIVLSLCILGRVLIDMILFDYRCL